MWAPLYRHFYYKSNQSEKTLVTFENCNCKVHDLQLFFRICLLCDLRVCFRKEVLALSYSCEFDCLMLKSSQNTWLHISHTYVLFVVSSATAWSLIKDSSSRSPFLLFPFCVLNEIKSAITLTVSVEKQKFNKVSK